MEFYFVKLVIEESFCGGAFEVGSFFFVSSFWIFILGLGFLGDSVRRVIRDIF